MAMDVEMSSQLQKELTVAISYIDMKKEFEESVSRGESFYEWKSNGKHETKYSISCSSPPGENIEGCNLNEEGTKCDEPSKERGCESRFRNEPDELIKLWNAVCDTYDKEKLKISASDIEEKFIKDKKEAAKKISPPMTPPQPPLPPTTLTLHPLTPRGGSKMKHTRKEKHTRKKKGRNNKTKNKSFK